MKKIRKGWYSHDGMHLVQTERCGNDKRLDWVAVKSHEEAEKIWHGGEVHSHEWIGNRLRDYPIQRAIDEFIEDWESSAQNAESCDPQGSQR